MDDREPKDAIEIRREPLSITAEPASFRSLPYGGPVPDPLASGLPLRDYLRVLRKHRWMIITVVVVMVTVVTIFTMRLPAIYQSTLRLEINGETPDLSNLRELFMTMPTDEEFLQTQVRILQSDDLAMQTVRALRLHERPEFFSRAGGAQNQGPFTPREEAQLIGGLRSRLNVQLLRGTRLVEIRYESTDPKQAADICNTLAETYIETNFRKKYESTLGATEWMAGQLQELKGKMEKAHGALVSYERANQIFSLNEGQNVTMQKLGELNHELTLAESERIARESQWQQVKSRAAQDLPALSQGSFYQDLQKRLSQLNDEHIETRATFGPNYPRVQRIERQMEEVRKQMEGERQMVAGRLESEYQAALRRERLLRRAVEQQKSEANVMNAKLVEYSLLKREYQTNQQLYDGLLNRLKEAGVSAGLRSNNVHIVDRARPPLAPIRPQRALNILMSLIVGLFVGGILALINDYFDNSVKMPDEVEQLVSLPALGIIPSVISVGSQSRRALPAAGLQARQNSSDLATVNQPQSIVSEAYRALRTSILLSTSKHPPQTILITSGQPREGKTTTALNLAITLAQRGDRVVLIDSDLRRPRVHRAFQLNNDQGLSTYLTGAVGLDNLPRAVRHIPNLFAIPSGPPPPNPAELLSSEPMLSLFMELRRQFDFIVLDSPPAITVADSMILASHADGVILVVHGGVTTRECLRHARKLMGSVSAKMIGVVLNNVDIRSADYQHYYTYYYGDYYRNMLDGYGYGHEPKDRQMQGRKKAGA